MVKGVIDRQRQKERLRKKGLVQGGIFLENVISRSHGHGRGHENERVYFTANLFITKQLRSLRLGLRGALRLKVFH